MNARRGHRIPVMTSAPGRRTIPGVSPAGLPFQSDDVLRALSARSVRIWRNFSARIVNNAVICAGKSRRRDDVHQLQAGMLGRQVRF